MTTPFHWKAHIYYFWKENLPKSMIESMESIGQLDSELGVFIFNPSDKRFAEHVEEFKKFKPTPESIRAFKLKRPELFGRDLDAVTKDRLVDVKLSKQEFPMSLSKFYDKDDVEIIQSRKETCSTCDNMVKLNQTTVQCSLCGCPGVSLLNGRCRAEPSKW
jgi:DnaJ-class molecular chaperone